MKSYKQGVFKVENCTANCTYDVNHAVLVVGYGTDEDLNETYWLIKNSWGEDWGEQVCGD